ncbi:MAG: hypothetical protein EOP39_02645 [Rubrivivax sp.]|nr:MAG: hypothetical protein EOP39_02645 [Rubrivivax sp.]
MSGVVWSNEKGDVAYVLQQATPKFNARGEVVELNDTDDKKLFEKGLPTDTGSNEAISWGRWTDGQSKVKGTGGPGVANGNLATMHHFTVTGAPIGATTGQFTSIASTSPTVQANGKLVATGSVNGATGAFTAALTLNTTGTASYTLTVPVSGQTFTLTGVANQTSLSTFAGVSVISSTGTGCNGGCNGTLGGNVSVIGQLAGSAGTHAGVLYGFDSRLGDVSGVIIFKR